MDKKNSEKRFRAPERIERLKTELNRKSAPALQNTERHALPHNEDSAPTDWKHADDVNFAMGRVDTKKSFATKLLLWAVGFFVIALGITGFFFFGGINVISSDNVDIEITAPATLEGGEEAAFDVEIINDNNVALQSVLIEIEYPDGTRSSTNTSVPLPRERVTIGDIPVNESSTRTFKAVLFGAEGEEQEIKVSIEYRVEGSNAIFSKEKTYPVLISGAPVRLTIDTLEQVISDQTFRTSVTVTSNATEVIEDVLLVADFPFGYKVIDSTPDADFNSNVWSLGDLAPGRSQTIIVEGALRGQNGEERAIRFTAGLQPDRDRRTIATPLITAVAPIEITAPFLATNIKVNGKDADTVVVSPESSTNVSLSWENNLTTSVTDVVIEARIIGNGFDPRTVKPQQGYYDSGRNVIVWDGRNINGLNRIRPGESGSANVTFTTRGYNSDNALVDPEINLDVTVTAVRESEGRVPEQVKAQNARTIKVETETELTALATYGTVISDSGPMPPKVGQTTTYTITWEVFDTTNDITNARVSATLPDFVEFTNVVFPNLETVRYNASNRTVTWDVGTVRHGVGFSGGERKVSFQVALTPSISQVGSPAIILNASELTARDSHTETTVGAAAGPLTTNIPGRGLGDANVVE